MVGLGVTGAVVGTVVTAGVGGIVIGGVVGAFGGSKIGNKKVKKQEK